MIWYTCRTFSYVFSDIVWNDQVILLIKKLWWWYDLLQHNLRLVLFVINRYFSDFSNTQRFQDLCQAGVKGLITAIDRFEPNRKFRLSTYGLFWIRHAIVRSMTLSSFSRVPFGLESVCILLLTTHSWLMFGFKQLTLLWILRNLRMNLVDWFGRAWYLLILCRLELRSRELKLS
jgi:hypothetical protein